MLKGGIPIIVVITWIEQHCDVAEVALITVQSAKSGPADTDEAFASLLMISRATLVSHLYSLGLGYLTLVCSTVCLTHGVLSTPTVQIIQQEGEQTHAVLVVFLYGARLVGHLRIGQVVHG